MTLTTLTGLTFTVGDGTGDTTMTFHGTLAAINTALATAKYTPTANYNGPAQIQLQVTDTFGGIVATGTGAATSDTDTIVVTVNSVNDEPAGTDDSANAIATIPYIFLATDFSDGFSDPIDGDSFAGVRITTLPAVGTLKLNGVAISAGDTITLAQLTAGESHLRSARGGGQHLADLHLPGAGRWRQRQWRRRISTSRRTPSPSTSLRPMSLRFSTSTPTRRRHRLFRRLYGRRRGGGDLRHRRPHHRRRRGRHMSKARRSRSPTPSPATC